MGKRWWWWWTNASSPFSSAIFTLFVSSHTHTLTCKGFKGVEANRSPARMNPAANRAQNAEQRSKDCGERVGFWKYFPNNTQFVSGWPLLVCRGGGAKRRKVAGQGLPSVTATWPNEVRVDSVGSVCVTVNVCEDTLFCLIKVFF